MIVISFFLENFTSASSRSPQLGILPQSSSNKKLHYFSGQSDHMVRKLLQWQLVQSALPTGTLADTSSAISFTNAIFAHCSHLQWACYQSRCRSCTGEKAEVLQIFLGCLINTLSHGLLFQLGVLGGDQATLCASLPAGTKSRAQPPDDDHQILEESYVLLNKKSINIDKAASQPGTTGVADANVRVNN